MVLTVGELDDAVGEALRQVASEVIRTRSLGVARMRELISDSRVLDGIREAGGEASWSHIYQSLDHALGIEVDAASKPVKRPAKSARATTPSSSVTAEGLNTKALARLKDFAALVSSLVDVSVTFLGRQSSKALLQHLVRALGNHTGEVFSTLLPSYLRALKTALTWRPHAEHLLPALWLSVVGLLWNLVLGKRVSTPLEPSHADLLRFVEGVPDARVKTHLSHAQTLDAFECLRAVFDTPCACFFLPAPSSDASQDPQGQDHYGPILLDKFLVYLTRSSSDVSATLPVIAALNVLLTALQLNERLAVTHFAATAVPLLTRLVATKNAALKEQLLVALDLLIPLLATGPATADSATSSPEKRKDSCSTHAKLSDLQRMMVDEGAAPCGLPPLKLSVLALRRTASNEHPNLSKGRYEGTRYAGWRSLLEQSSVSISERIQFEHNPFYMPSFSAGFGFAESSAAAASWLALEIASSTTHFLLQVANEAQQASSRTESDQTPSLSGSHQSPLSMSERPGKRQRSGVSVTMPKRLDGISYLLSTLQVTDAVTTLKRVWTLQVLTFWLECYPGDLPMVMALGSEVLYQLAEAVHDHHEEVASWATLALASAARSLSLSTGEMSFKAASVWEHVWPVLLQRIMLPHLSRPSAALANVLLHEGFVDPATLPGQMNAMVLSLSSQALAQPSECLCELMVRALEILRVNCTGPQASVDKSALTVSHMIWVPGFAFALMSPQPRDYEVAAIQCGAVDMLALLTALSGFCTTYSPPLVRGGPIVGRTPTSDHLVSKAATSRALHFMLYADVGETTASCEDQRVPKRVPTRDPVPLEGEHPASFLLSSLLNTLKTIQQRLTEYKSTGPSLSKSNVPELKRHVDAAVLSLLFAGLARQQAFDIGPELTRLAFTVLEAAIRLASSRNRATHDKAVILSGLATLSLPPEISIPAPLIALPSDRSQVSPVILNAAKKSQRRPKHDHLFFALFRAACTVEAAQSALLSMLSTLYKAIEAVVSEAQLGDDARDQEDGGDDGFSDFDEEGVSLQAVSQSHLLLDNILDGSLSHGVVSGLFAALCVLHKCARPLDDVALDIPTEPNLLLVDGPQYLSRAVMLLNAANEADKHDLLVWEDDTLQDLTDLVSNQILAHYVYSRAPQAHGLALCLLRLGLRRFLHAASGGSVVDADWLARLRDLTDWFLGKAHKRALSTWPVINGVADLCSQFLSQVDLYEFFEPNEELIFKWDPASVLMALTSHWDTRIRLHACTLLPALFGSAVNSTGDMDYEHKMYLSYAKARSSVYERQLTGLIMFANSAIVAPMARCGSIGSILAIPYQYSGYGLHIQATLAGVAARLGFSNAQELFRSYNLLIVNLLQDGGLDMLNLPWHLLGYVTVQDGVRDNMDMMGAAMCAGDTGRSSTSISRLCELAGVTLDQYFDVVRPLLFAVALGDEIFTTRTVPGGCRKDAWTRALKSMLQVGAQGKSKKIEKLIQESKDQVVAWLLRFTTVEQSLANDEELVLSVALARPAVRDFLTSIMAFEELPDETVLPPPNRPSIDVTCLIDALLLLDETLDGGVFDSACCYQVLQHIFATLADTEMMDLRVGLARVIPIYFSLCKETLEEHQALFVTVLQRGVPFLADTRLVPIIFPVLYIVWTCVTGESPEATADDFRIRHVWLTSIVEAGFLVDGTLREADRRMAELVAEHLTTLVRDSFKSTRPALNETARQVLYFWPDSLAHTVNEQVQPKTQLHKCVRAMSQYPKLVLNTRSLSDMVAVMDGANEAAVQRFSQRGLWLLKRQLTLHSGKNPHDASLWGFYFSAILLLCGGHFVPPPADIWSQMSLVGVDQTPENIDDPTSLWPILSAVLTFWKELPTDPHENFFFALRTLVSQLPLEELVRLRESFGDHNSEEGELDWLHNFTSTLNPAAKPLEVEDIVIRSSDWALDGYIRWVSGMAEGMARALVFTSPVSEFFAHLAPLLSDHWGLAANIFSPLVLQLLADERKSQPGRSTSQGKALASCFTRLLCSDTLDPQIHVLIVRCILYLRLHDPSRFSLDVDYLMLGQRALQAGLYSAALLFVELNHDHSSDAQRLRQLDLQTELLHAIYQNVDDPDGFYSLPPLPGRSDGLYDAMRHEGRWQIAFEITAADREVQHQTQIVSGPLASPAEPLRQLGFYTLSSDLLVDEAGTGGLNTRSLRGFPWEAPDEVRPYNIGWQASRWDLPTARNGAGHLLTGSGACLYTALRGLNALPTRGEVLSDVDWAQSTLLRGMAELPHEPSKALNDTCLEMMGVSEVQKWLRHSRAQPLSMAALDVMANAYMGAGTADLFRGTEPDAQLQLAQVRWSLVQSVRTQRVRTSIGGWDDEEVRRAVEVESDLCRQISRLAREQRRLQVSMTMNKMIQQLECAVGDRCFASVLEFANMLWAYGQHAEAQKFLSSNLNSRKSKATTEQAGDALTQMAMWHSEARSEQPYVIQQEYFEKAIDYIRAGNLEQEAQSLICHRFATFAFSQYKRGQTDTDARQLRGFIAKRTEELVQNEALSRTGMDDGELRSLMLARNEAKLTLNDDQHRLATWEAAQSELLKHAMVMSARAVVTSDLYDESLLRFTSLWFENADNQWLNEALEGELKQIPSWKFVDLAHQISSRLSRLIPTQANPRDVFHQLIHHTMYRICRDHPFQTLYALYAMRSVGMENGESVVESFRRGQAGESSQGISMSQILRAAAADDIWGNLMVHPEPQRQSQLSSMAYACDAYVEWAKFDLRSKGTKYYSGGAIKKGDLHMPKPIDVRLSGIRDLDAPVATAEVPIDKTGQYARFVSVKFYLPTFTTAGGVHLPKIVTCVGSDGKFYKQLFKDKDDLRQDAVMQQVFRLVNRLLAKDSRTRPRKLRIRTYLVRPLGERWGLLQFVDNTQPLYALLTTLHQQYRNPRQKQLTPYDGRQAIHKAMMYEPEKRIKVYRDCAKRMPPVFRHFFTGTFKEPMAWFSSRLAYSRSLATTSIVGHVLGLGDRHVSNILVDIRGGELVHIDFGVAFDQGKLLRFPETIPFRLTRDMVDGLGLPGLDGAFRQCSQETLRVLRQGTELIKTILEVFKYDPLFTWTSNPVKVLQNERREDLIVNGAGPEALQRLQDDPELDRRRRPSIRHGRTPGQRSAASASEEGGKLGVTTAEIAADRALATVLNKLSTNLSVEYSVNELIQQARSERNLALLFSGWQALL